jgi:hypothetical protein
MKKEYYKKLDTLVDNYIVNKKGIFEIITLVKKMINRDLISNYKVKQINRICDIDIKYYNKRR